MNEITYFIDFEYTNEIIKSVYKSQNQFIFRIVFINEKSLSGFVYRSRRKDYFTQNYITVELDDKFYEFYLRYKNSKEFDGIDLRVVWFLNNDKTIQYKIKYVRDSMYIFNVLNLCQAYDYPDPVRGHIIVACNNHAFGKINDMFYCLKHMRN